MGISGLLPLLKEVQVKKHVSDFKGKSLAIDGYVWLHKGAFGCAEDLVTGSKTTKFVDYAMYRVRMLRHHGVTPLLVFDGGPLPAKRGTEVDRASKRNEHMARAKSLTAQGRHKEARDHYTKCVDITPEMALQLIKALKAEQVPYVVAPYEADAQLAYLEKEGIVDGIITEDSDLLVFGCKNVVYKLDGDGECIHIVRENFAMCREFSFAGWGETEFRRMAILAGCDYLDSIPGIGIKTAHKLLRKHKTIEKVVQNVRLDGNLPVPSDYIAQFRLAELVFLHQRVYNPRTGRLDTLFPVLKEGGLGELEEGYIGPDMDPVIAKGIAEGRTHPESKEELEDLWPDYYPGIARGGQASSSAGVFGKKNPLGLSKKVNVAGPLDAFIKRLPVKKEAPGSRIFLPTPVGMRGSGPARLSDLSVSKRKAAEAAELQAILKENRALQSEEEAAGQSKFFGSRLGRRASGTRPIEDDLEITFFNTGPMLREEEDPKLVTNVGTMNNNDGDHFPEISSPPAACSSLQSPSRSSQHGSHFSSPGRESEEEKPADIPESSGSSRGLKRRSLLPASPSNRLGSKKRRLTTTPPRGEPILAAASSPIQVYSPEKVKSKTDLRELCGADDSSSFHADWETSAKSERPRTPSDEDESQEKINARAVAKGLRAKYTFTPKPNTPHAGKPSISRYNTTPIPIRPTTHTTLFTKPLGHTRSFDRIAPTDSPTARAFADATAAFSKTPRPTNRMTRNNSTSKRRDRQEPILSRYDSMDSDDIIEIEDDDDDAAQRTPTRAIASMARPREAGVVKPERQMSGSEKLLSFRYSG